MKTCQYCGRENALYVAHCVGCGTEFTTVAAKDEEHSDRGWIKTVIGWAASGVSIILIYFLSFGPIIRSFETVLSSTSTPTGTGLKGAFVARTVSYPGWVAVLYAPAFWLRSADTGEFGNLYREYLQWWEKEPLP